MTEKLRCWPGCHAEFVCGSNRGARVIVVELIQEYRAITGRAFWRVQALSIVTAGDTGRTGLMSGYVEDSSLRPIDPIPDPESITTDEQVPA